MATEALQFYRYQARSAFTYSSYPYLESNSNGIIFESNPIWIRIADPNRFRPFGSVTLLGTVPFEPDLVQTGAKFLLWIQRPVFEKNLAFLNLGSKLLNMPLVAKDRRKKSLE